MGRARLEAGRLGFVLVGLIGVVAHAAPHFTEMASERGIGEDALPVGLGSGLAAADFDADGDVDLFVPTEDGVPPRLYVNDGSGHFADEAVVRGLAFPVQQRSALWFDYDGDQALDLLVATDLLPVASAFRLYRQLPGGAFEDVTVAAGLFIPPDNPDVHHRGGMVAGDLDRDGYLDLVVGTWNGPARVLQNDRNGGFIDISYASGVRSGWHHYHQPVLADFNVDGWLDIYFAVDFSPNELWINNHDATFTNVAASAGADNAMNDMGVTVGDYDNDGDFDLYVTNIYYEIDGIPDEHNVLLRNDTVAGVVQFSEVAVAMGVSVGHWGWGASFCDFDNDGDLDIGATNGWRSGAWLTDPSRFFINNGPAVPFTDAGQVVQFEDTYYGSALLAFDADRDGDVDLLQATQPVVGVPSRVRLLDNQQTLPGDLGHFLGVRPRMDGPNAHAIGAVCRATVGGVTQMRLITAGTSYLGQEPAEAHFGLGTAAMVDLLEVRWPDGTQTSLAHVAGDAVLTIEHGGFGDLDADGDLDGADQALFAQCLGGPVAIVARTCQAADVNGDRSVDLADYAVVQARDRR